MTTPSRPDLVSGGAFAAPGSDVPGPAPVGVPPGPSRRPRVPTLTPPFVAALGHELRTPLLPVVMGAELLLTDEGAGLTASQRRLMDSMRRCSTRLGGVVELLLLLLESEVEPAPGETVLELGDVVREARSRTADALSRHGTVLVTDLDPAAAVHGHHTHLARALGALVVRGAQSAARTVWLTVQTTADDVVVCVRDDGDGIAAVDLDPAADAARRADPESVGVGAGGSRLTLDVVRAVVEAHGGGAAVHRHLGSGTSVVLTLPRARVDGDLLPTAPPARG